MSFDYEEKKVRVGLEYHPEDWGNSVPRKEEDPFDYFYKIETDSINAVASSQDEKEDISEIRIRENEIIRNALEPYLRDIECLGIDNLSEEQVNDIVLETIISQVGDYCDDEERETYKGHFRLWKKYGIQQTRPVTGKPADVSIINKNICGYVPICIKTSRGFRKETEFYCRNSVTNALVRIKQSILKQMIRGKKITGNYIEEVG